jgi:hypothetical protein
MMTMAITVVSDVKPGIVDPEAIFISTGSDLETFSPLVTCAIAVYFPSSNPEVSQTYI